MDTELKCGKCGGAMSEGSVLHCTEGGKMPLTAWIDGQLERTWFGCIKTPADKKRTIAAFRCSTCGLMDLYAK